MRKRTPDYPIGSVSCATMRFEDLIPTFLYELQTRRRRRTINREHIALVKSIEKRMDKDGYYESEAASYDLEWLCSALEEYAGPYFYFGAHPGDGADFGYWLSEFWNENFISPVGISKDDMPESIKVSDLSEVPTWYCGEVALVSDHGNVTLYNKTARKFHEVWSIV